MTAAYRTRLGNLTAKSVLALIVDEANAEGLGFSGIDRIVTLTEVKLRTVQRVVQVLTEIDLVSRTEAELKGKVRPAFQVNLARLGLDLRAEFAAALAKASRKCLRDTSTRVSGTRKNVSATRQSVSETQPPNPLIGGPFLAPCSAPTPIAPSAEGAGGIEAATDQVCSAVGVSNRRKRRTIRDAVALAAEKGELPPTIALEMIAAIRDQDAAFLDGRLKYKFGLEKLVGQGYWRDRKRWGWDTEALRMRAAASVGSYR